MRNMSSDPFALDEVIAIIDVYKALHGEEDAREKMRQWAAPKTFTPAAFDYVCSYLEETTP
jgi:hypothetical protein